MKKQLLTSLLVLLFLTTTSIRGLSQDNYVAGTVITLNRDTLKGFINDQLWQYSPPSVSFKDKEGKILKFFPKDILEFQVDGKNNYKSRLVKYDTASNSIEHLSSRFVPSLKTDYLFLKSLVKAEASLLVLQKPDNEHFFIETDSATEFLVFHRYYGTYKGQRVIRENRSYVEQLRIFFKDCPSIKIPDGLLYSSMPLRKLFVQYNTCKNSDFEVTDKKEKAIRSYGFTVFVSRDYLKPYTGGMGYGLGPSLVIKSPHNNYKFSIYTDFLYRRMAKQTGRFNGYEEYVKMQSMQWTFIGRSRLVKDYSGMYVGVGISVQMGLPDEYGITFNTYRTTILGKKAWFENSLIFNTGLAISENVTVELRYEYGLTVPYFKDFPEHYTRADQRSSLQFAGVFQF